MLLSLNVRWLDDSHMSSGTCGLVTVCAVLWGYICTYKATEIEAIKPEFKYQHHQLHLGGSRSIVKALSQDA